ncbi:hypothetical protein [Umezawaea sp. Da 62-37]|uniref:hypothetical protein n=1 Tax=Umezawaea sp. Da 62-37 TaxID=3075927 RepID=UPI0028F6C6DA|nr:hypothetical protein [Umezawaea sp. Da 62-37]WNV85157.1 hypothetical protein RM788_44660 [Umezawaea sp. Da 62-37]
MNTGIVFAVLVMVASALIPRRLWRVQPPAVLGWSLVRVDGEWADHWTDSAGLAVTGCSLLWLRWIDGGSRPDEHGSDAQASTK